jgi:hypothetical protein
MLNDSTSDPVRHRLGLESQVELTGADRAGPFGSITGRVIRFAR